MAAVACSNQGLGSGPSKCQGRDTSVAGVGNFFQNIGGIAQALCGIIAGRGGPGKIAEQCCQTEYPENQMSFHDPSMRNVMGDNRALYHRKLRSEQAAIRKNVDEFVKRYPVRLGVR